MLYRGSPNINQIELIYGVPRIESAYAEMLGNKCGFENYVFTTLKICLVTGTSPIPVNQKIFLLMLQLSMTTTLTVQSIDFTVCIIKLNIFANLHKTV